MKAKLNPKTTMVLLAGATGLVCQPALAYVGPGAGLTLLAALWGLVVAVALALGFVILWPIRRWRRRRREAAELEDAGADPAQEALTVPRDQDSPTSRDP